MLIVDQKYKLEFATFCWVYYIQMIGASLLADIYQARVLP